MHPSVARAYELFDRPDQRESEHDESILRSNLSAATRRRTPMQHGITARIAYGIMLKTRAELIAMHEAVDHEAVNELMKNIRSATAAFKELIGMLDAAYLRVLASAAAHEKAGGKFKRAA